MKLFQNLRSGFFREYFEEYLISPHSAKSLRPHSGHVFRRIKISRTLFEKGHPRNNPVTLFQNLTNGFRGEEIIPNSVNL